MINSDPLFKAIVTRLFAANISHKQAAQLAGVSEKTFQRCVNGTTDLRLTNISALLAALNVTYLDVALDMIRAEEVGCHSVASVARLLTPEMRAILIEMMVQIHLDTGQ